MDNQIYIFTHANPTIKTVGEYVNDSNSPAFQYSNDIRRFLDVKNKEGVTNEQSINARYPLNRDSRQYEGKDLADRPLMFGTKLAVEMEKVERAALLTEGIEVFSNDITAFKADALAKLESDKRYVPLRMKPVEGQELNGTASVCHPAVSVWLWSKALSEPRDMEHRGQIFNLTPYVTKLTTTVTKNTGGNFQLSLAPIVGTLENSKWVLKKQTISYYQADDSLQGNQFYASDNLYNLVTDETDSHKNKLPDSLRRNSFLFNSIIGPNDLIFIRFDVLASEKARQKDDAFRNDIGFEELPGQIYDMIGLVDKTTMRVSAENTDVGIDIQGRDLSKLFLEDGCYFFPAEFTKGKMSFAGAAANGNPIMNRVASENALLYLGLYYNNTIENIFKFVIQQLSNVKIVPDKMFESYGDRKNKRYNTESTAVVANRETDNNLNQYKAKAKAKISHLRKSIEYQLPNVHEEKAKVEEIFNELKRFLITIREKKVRKVSNNQTLGWKKFQYVNINGVPEDLPENQFMHYVTENLYSLPTEAVVTNHTINELVPLIDNYIDISKGQPHKPEYKETDAAGIWQIVKLVIDEKVAGRRLVDSSISSASGSLMNLFKKSCQEPFVEYQMDTYGDMFYIMLRKSPFDRKSIVSALKGVYRTEEDDGKNERKTEDEKQDIMLPVVINIDATDVIRESLEFSDAEAISWYQLIPRANMYDQRSFATALYPAVYFPEYAAEFGSKTMQLNHYYLPGTAFERQNTNSARKIQAQVIEDLRFMIESTAYLPFTRSGTIIINRDRRIKVGNFIRYLPTGEIFYVNAVQHSYAIADTTIDGYTTIQVSRGMIEQLIYGIPIELDKSLEGNGDTYASYFNIIETPAEISYRYVDAPPPASNNDNTTNQQGSTSAGKQDTSASSSVYRDDKIMEMPNSNMQIWELKKYPEKYKRRFIQLINAINQNGYWVHVVDTVRTSAEQEILWRKPGEKNAKPGNSRHEIGTAIDINIINKRTGKWCKKYSSEHSWLATNIPQLARSLGFQWAGGDGTFGSYVDRAHFQIASDVPASAKKVVPEKKEQPAPTQQQVVDLEATFRNFRVNKNVFNYFLRRQQMSTGLTTVSSTIVIEKNNTLPSPEIKGWRTSKK